MSWKNKWVIKTIGSNYLRFGSIFAGKMCFNMAVKAKYFYVYFAEQYWSVLISGILESKRSNKAYGGAEIKKHLRTSIIIFLSLRILIFFSRWTKIQDIFRTLWDHFRSCLSENIASCWTSSCLTFHRFCAFFTCPVTIW